MGRAKHERGTKIDWDSTTNFSWGMVAPMVAIFKRAWKETFAIFGGWGIVFGALAIPFAGFLLHYATAGLTEMMGEVEVWLIYGAAATGMVFALVFLCNLVRAPYLIERDAHIATQVRLASIEQDTPLPNAVLRSLTETQQKSAALNQQLLAVAKLVEQYRRLFAASTTFNQKIDPSLRYDDVVEVSNFLLDQSKDLLPSLPYGPKEPLIFEVDWNKYRYIFNVPMRVPPKVTFPDLPDGVRAEIHHVSRLFVDVQFFNSTNAADRILPQGFIADAELP